MENQTIKQINLIRFLFDRSADRYERDIVPVFMPLAADLVAYAAPRPRDRVLDVGCGTGIITRLIAPYVRRVVGVDLSLRSLTIARRQPAPDRVDFCAADLHRMPFRPGAFTLAVSSFGLNATDPEYSLRALRRAIQHGGRLVIQEWGPLSPLDRAFNEVWEAHLPDNPGPTVAALRAQIETHPARWGDRLQDVDDYAEWLVERGFAIEDVSERAPVRVRLASVEQYLAYKLAWTQRYEEVNAMDDGARAALIAALRERLDRLAAADGSLIWEPMLFRVMARRD